MSPSIKPTIFTTPFAENGEKTIPPLVQAAEGRASLQDGFPVETGQPIRSGGIPPLRADFNGALNLATGHNVFQILGGRYTFEAEVADAGGYPKGAVLGFSNPAMPFRVRSLKDDNKDDFNTGAGIGTSWVLEGPGVMAWSSGFIYLPPCLVFGADGKLYTCLQASGPGTDGGAREPSANAGYWQDYASTIQAEKYDIGQYVWFQDEMPRAGHFALLGGFVENFSRYTKGVEYFETPYGQRRLVTLNEYRARHVAIWATLANGDTVGWGNEGGANCFVWNKDDDTLLLPDLAGMSMEQASSSLGVGDVHGWGMPRMQGDLCAVGLNTNSRAFVEAAGVFTQSPAKSLNTYVLGASGMRSAIGADFDTARVMSTTDKVQTAAFGVLACVYLGRPAS